MTALTSSDIPALLPPETVATAFLVVIVTSVLLVYRERLQRALAAYSGRQKLYHLLAQHKADGRNGTTDDGPTVSSLYIHPIKSLRSVSVPSTSISRLGLNGDRCLMLVKPSTSRSSPGDATHRFVTQRQVASLATIQASLPTMVEGRTIVRLSANDADGGSSEKTVHIDVTPSIMAACPIKYRAGLWDDVVTVVDVGDEAAQFVRAVIAQDDDKYAREAYGDVRVVSFVPGETHRPLDDRYLPPAALALTGGIPTTTLNDGFPVLVACEASLEELNRRLVQRGKEPIPMSRFRPNIVIRGTKPFEEDTWKSIWIKGSSDDDDDDNDNNEGVILHIVKGCPRCKQSCTDQMTGKRSEEPLETMATFRALGRNKEDVYFAQNAVPHGKGGVLSVGDSVVVLERGEPVWDKDTVQAE